MTGDDLPPLTFCVVVVANDHVWHWSMHADMCSAEARAARECVAREGAVAYVLPRDAMLVPPGIATRLPAECWEDVGMRPPPEADEDTQHAADMADFARRWA